MKSDPVSDSCFAREMPDLFGNRKRFVRYDENMEKIIVSF